MANKMPSRPRQHVIESKSEREFLNSIPSEWTATKPDADYGVDLDVEVFDADVATGVHIYVQLKSTDKSKSSTKIKQSTLNYWALLDVPTLIVQYSAADESLRWQWSYLLEFASATETATSTVQLPNIWTRETPDLLFAEALSRRVSKSPAGHFPIFIDVVGEGRMFGDAAGLVRGELRRLATDHPLLTSVRAKATPLRIDVELLSDQVTVRLRGQPYLRLTYVNVQAQFPAKVVEFVASEVRTCIGLQLSRIGLLDIGAALVARALEHCSLIDSPQTTSELVSLLVRSRRYDDLLRLLDRLFLAPDTVSGVSATVALLASGQLIPLDVRRQIAQRVRFLSWPAEALGTALYNAGALLRHDDFGHARELYELAALSKSSYRSRGYWWSEQGSTFFHEGKLDQARAFYSRALELGYAPARPLLADVLLRSGRYIEAIREFHIANEDPNLSQPQWRLTETAFAFLTEHFDIQEQVRNPEAAEDLIPRVDMQSWSGIEEVLKQDLLNWFALWAATNIARVDGTPTLPFVLGAACVVLRLPVLWEESVRIAYNQYPYMVEDMVLCIKQNCREEFLAFLDEDRFLNDSTIQALQSLFDFLPEPEEPKFNLRDAVGNPIDGAE